MSEQIMQARPSLSRPMRGLLMAHRSAGAPVSEVRPTNLRTASTQTADVKTQGEIEAAVCEGIQRFELDHMGRGPKEIRVHLLSDLLVIRLTSVLTASEQHLAGSLPTEKGRDLIKQVRTHLVETARPILEQMIHTATGVSVVSLHHDISTATGEEMIVFTLADSPFCREAKRR